MDKQSEPDGKENPILIRKYPNRRLYNTATSSYIVLDDIVELVKTNKSFVIIDNKSGDDITRSILNQVIYERESGQSNFLFPLDVQKQLIMMYDDAYGSIMPSYFRESMKAFNSEREKMKEAFGEIVGQNTNAMVEFGQEVARRNMEMFSRSFDMFSKISGLSPADVSSKEAEEQSSNQAKESQDEDDKETALKDMQEQIKAMQDQLKELSKK
ncbi:MAG: polyhydroxyalkanoate synthesis repressor PhaR [Pseudomonadota bacterium]